MCARLVRYRALSLCKCVCVRHARPNCRHTNAAATAAPLRAKADSDSPLLAYARWQCANQRVGETCGAIAVAIATTHASSRRVMAMARDDSAERTTRVGACETRVDRYNYHTQRVHTRASRLCRSRASCSSQTGSRDYAALGGRAHSVRIGRYNIVDSLGWVGSR